MSKFLKALSVATLTVAAASVFAGGVEQAPMMRDASGMFVGFGGGWNSLTHNYSAVTGEQNTAAATYNFGPFAQVGYWGHINQTWLWGVKGFYKYLNASTGAAGYTTTTDQEAGAQVMFGTNWKRATFYVAGGAVWLPTVSGASGSAGNLRKGLWGGIFSLGMRKDVNQDWFIDTAYSYAFSQKYTFSSGATARTNRATVQSLDVSLNYRFAV